MAPFTAGFTDSPMQIVDSFQGFHRFCGVVEATDRTIISRQTSTVPCSGIRLLSPPRGTSITTCASAEARVHRLGQQDGRNTQPLRLAQGGQPFAMGDFCPIMISTSPRCRPISCSARLKPVRFITYAGRPIRLNNRAVYSARIPEAPIPKIPTGARR